MVEVGQDDEVEEVVEVVEERVDDEEVRVEEGDDEDRVDVLLDVLVVGHPPSL